MLLIRVWLPARLSVGDAARRYRSVEPPEALEATCWRALRRTACERRTCRGDTGVVRSGRRGVAGAGTPARRRLAGAWPCARIRRWQGLSLCVVLAFAAPWWLPLVGTATEQTTPFMLVAEPAGGRALTSRRWCGSVCRGKQMLISVFRCHRKAAGAGGRRNAAWSAWRIVRCRALHRETRAQTPVLPLITDNQYRSDLETMP